MRALASDSTCSLLIINGFWTKRLLGSLVLKQLEVCQTPMAVFRLKIEDNIPTQEIELATVRKRDTIPWKHELQPLAEQEYSNQSWANLGGYKWTISLLFEAKVLVVNQMVRSM